MYGSLDTNPVKCPAASLRERDLSSHFISDEAMQN